MGLFEVSGKRNATLKASKRSILLDIDYDFIRPPSGSLNSGENMMRLEIQRGIWQFYTARSIENKVVSHKLFEGLDKEARYMLIDNARFVPNDYQTSPELTPEEIWENFIFIVNGSITVSSLLPDGKDGKNLTPCTINYGVDDCLGTIRLVKDKNPYTQIEILPGTQFICFPRHIIDLLCSKYDKLNMELLRLGHNERKERRLG